MAPPSSPHSHSLPPMPPSPTASFASTAFPTPSLNLPPPPPPLLPKNFLSRSDVATSITAYQCLLEAAKAYRKALAATAGAASAFGAALETCAKCKGAGDTAEGLMNAGGLQYLIASNTHILSESLYRGFEVPLLHELDSYREKTNENEERYKKEACEKSRELRRREQEHLKLARQRKRNLSSFRSTLVDLTRQVDELDNLKYTHYRSALSLSEETSTRILDSSALVVRAEMEIFEKIAQKAWDSSSGLGNLMSRSADPFAHESGNGVNGEGEIFSILPSQSILPSPHSPGMSRSDSTTDGNGGAGGHGGGTEGKYQSLTGALSHHGDFDEYGDDDVKSIFSGGFSNPSGLGCGGGRGKIGIPPFSPSASSAGGGIHSGQRGDSTNANVAPLDLPPTLSDEARAITPGGGILEETDDEETEGSVSSGTEEDPF